MEDRGLVFNETFQMEGKDTGCLIKHFKWKTKVKGV